MPTKNVVRSTLTANLSNAWTTITITPWEASLFEIWVIATIEQLNVEWKATAREVVSIVWINWDTLTIVRWYENCVMDDTATPKELWNTPQSFTAWAKISVYISRALLNWVQVRLKDYNLPCNISVYNQEMVLTQCIANNCDDWRDALYNEKIRRCYNDCWFWDWSDWDCVIETDTFLNANCNYNFKNLTICSWVLVRFCWAGIPRINVQRKFCNMGTIDLRGWTYVWGCSKVDCITGCTVSNNYCQAEYNALCLGCGWAWWSDDWKAGCNATNGCWWKWWKWGCDWAEWADPSWYNWGNGATWWSYWWGTYSCGWWWGWGWGWYWTWNWGRWWDWWYSYKWVLYANWWDWGNGWIWWRWWDWWTWWWSNNSYTSTNHAFGWHWGNGYMWWNWWNWGNYSADRQWTEALCGGKWWNWIICWWNAGISFHSTWTRGHWGCAINNMYGLIIHACEYYNNCIEARWGCWWNWSSEDGFQSSTWHTPWDWGCWANGWKVSVAYIKLLQAWNVNVAWWCWWKWGCAYCKSWWDYVRWVDWANWNAWRSKTCKLF